MTRARAARFLGGSLGPWLYRMAPLTAPWLMAPAFWRAAESPPVEQGTSLELLTEEQDVDLFRLGELVPSTDRPLGPTSGVFETSSLDILDQNARSVADALRFVPGLCLWVGGGKNPSNAVVRRLTIRQTVVFIDGSPVTNSDFTGRQPNHVNLLLLNGKLSYEAAKGIRPFVAIENLGSSNYERVSEFPESARRFFIGVNATF